MHSARIVSGPEGQQPALRAAKEGQQAVLRAVQEEAQQRSSEVVQLRCGWCTRATALMCLHVVCWIAEAVPALLGMMVPFCSAGRASEAPACPPSCSTGLFFCWAHSILLCREAFEALTTTNQALAASIQQLEQSAADSQKLLLARIVQLEEAAANQVRA